ncbi:MAG: hypothetical protein ACE5JX_14650 [Acidobacteriota bacterium]
MPRKPTKQALWNFRFIGNRTPGPQVGIVQASTHALAIEVAKAWCKRTGHGFGHDLKPMILADESILKKEKITLEIPDQELQAMSLGVLKPLLEAGSVPAQRVYTLEKAKLKSEQRRDVLLLCERYINSPEQRRVAV